MSNFNKTNSTKTKNHEGAVAYTMPLKEELVSMVVSSFLQDTFYESTDERTARLSALVAQVAKTDPEFVAKLAVYARKQMYLRTVPVVLVVELAKHHSGDNLVSRAVTQIVERVDDMTELLAYYAISNSRTEFKKLHKLSNQIKIGLQTAFLKFDAYQFGKYNRDKTVTVKDVLFLSHIKPETPEQTALFDQIVNDTLPTPDTWETAVSKDGNIAAVWERLINENKLGYMALLRNLRNILQANVSLATVEKVVAKLTKPEAVLKSKQLPFRFFSAYRELQAVSNQYVSSVMQALDTAANLSAKENVPWLSPDKSYFLAVDVSGSMEGTLSPKSKVSYKDVALLQAATVAHVCKNFTLGMFAERFGVVNIASGSPVCSTVTGLKNQSNNYGGATNGYLVLEHLIKNNLKYRYVIFFTDCQLYNSATGMMYYQAYDQSFNKLWTEYKRMNPDAEMIIFNLAGYATTPVSVNREDVTQISGWSDRIYDLLNSREFSTVVEKVEAQVV